MEICYKVYNFLMVDIETNPLYYAAAGGVIVGIATSLHYVLKGSVTGMSGILYGIVSLQKNDLHNKLSLIGGIIFAGALMFQIFGYGTYNNFTPFGPEYQITEYTSYLGYALAGLLVGFGTKLANGCTSGHGLCGLARLSIRSFVAIITFLFTAIIMGTIRYYFTLGPFTSEQLNPQLHYEHIISSGIILGIGILLFVLGIIIENKNFNEKSTGVLFRDNLISWVVGFIFSMGLVVSGMCRRRNILQFLWIGQDWNPSLLFVLGCGVMINLIVFQYMIRVRKVPCFGDKLFNPDNKTIDWKLIVGAVCFGLGWGIGGLCPGPAMALIPLFNMQIHVVWFIAAILGMLLANKLNEMTSKATSPQKEPQLPKKQPDNNNNSPINVNKIVESSEQLKIKNEKNDTENTLLPQNNQEKPVQLSIQLHKFQNTQSNYISSNRPSQIQILPSKKNSMISRNTDQIRQKFDEVEAVQIDDNQ